MNQIRNIWRIRNPKIYYLHNIVKKQLAGLNYYIEYIPDKKNQEIKALSEEALYGREYSDAWHQIKENWNISNENLYYPYIWQ